MILLNLLSYRNMKTKLFSFLFALIAGVGMVCASDTEVDGIWYDFDDDAMTGLPPLGDRQYTEEMFTYIGLTGVKWGTYNGASRAAGIESPIAVWNGTAYSTYMPGIDEYILQPFEAFFIQKPDNGAATLTFDREYLR